MRVNEVGYISHGPKFASVEIKPAESDIAGGLTWRLVREDDVVAEGTTEPFGLDADSGRLLHHVDFSQAESSGDGFRIEVGGSTSPEFAIVDRPYAQLKVDALRYFFHNRSGTAIEMPYAGEERWARPAGHAESDREVPCHPSASCDYELDVSGGWYDAGDHGKYVVNAGISVWTLMNLYETSPGALGDDTGIPESGNGVSDLLDEVRWELEFMLRMQVPEGESDTAEPNAGMVHHKVHDEEWTPLPITPHEAEQQAKRFLHPISTAATLNLAATAAQASRIWREIDPDFSKRCLHAAERAWRAAQAKPDAYATWSRDVSGGGAYSDDDVSDEFFWAASELWITTRQAEYRTAMTASLFWSQRTETVQGLPTAMTWNRVDMLGTMSLLTASLLTASLLMADASLEPDEFEVQRRKLVEVANRLLGHIETQGYDVPFGAGATGGYPWGSNSFVLNNLLVLGTARLVTGDLLYLRGMVKGVDYLFGRNPLSRSYVTGYGANPARNPHHRFWAHQADPEYPEPPPGAVVGGPNSRMQDDYVKEHSLEGCAPQTCYVDHVEAYSVNEVAINWNAPLVWVAAYLDRPELWLQASAVLE